MTERTERFSRKHDLEPQDREIRLRNAAPPELREAIVEIAYEVGAQPSDLRAVICQLLRKRADPNNWSEYPNINDEVYLLISNCEWFEVYDIIEAIATDLPRIDARKLEEDKKESAVQYFEREVNRYFRREGIGWQLVQGEIRIRGPEMFEAAVRKARQTLTTTARPTAAHELHQALQDLSRRPEPDVTGAIQHGMAALECVARDVTGDDRATLGDILKRHPNLLPRPLDQCVEKAWGFASEMGRHLREGRTPGITEAELVVSLCASVSDYVATKHAGRDKKGV